MDSTEAQTQQEIARVVSIVEELTGLPSRWSGRVELVAGAEFRGKKLFSCAILLDAAVARRPVRWRTLIHEVLHSVSAGYIRADYDALIGWEEGTVEQLQRLLRRQVLNRLSVDVPEGVFVGAEANYSFNPYIDALEDVRNALEVPSPDFYLRLLNTSIGQRPGSILGQTMVLTGAARREVLQVFSRSNAVLKEVIKYGFSGSGLQLVADLLTNCLISPAPALSRDQKSSIHGRCSN